MQRKEQRTVTANSLLAINVGIEWQGKDCSFSDWRYLPSVSPGRDHLPWIIEQLLIGKASGERIEHTFKPGELVAKGAFSQQFTVDVSKFQPSNTGLHPTIPALGRFYPGDFIPNLPVSYQNNELPCRIVGIHDNQLKVDFNHPLADKTLKLTLVIECVKQAGTERGEQRISLPSAICDQGPGMQDELPDAETNFMAGKPFARADERNDSEIFKPRLTPFWDQIALMQVSQIYSKLIPPDSRILDLMAGVHSPLQESDIRPARLTAAGLNQQELKANPICDEHHVIDVNAMSALPFADAQFDVILIHAAIEYVIRPQVLFSEIRRVLRSGGKIIISFSNRSADQKVIQLWSQAYEFERPGIVLSYLRHTGGFHQFSSYSQRGLFRPENDELANKLLFSDPVYLVNATKA